MMSFTAKLGAAMELPELNAFTVVLAEQPDGEGSRLEIQVALTHDESDREAGMNTYCLCTHTGATYYGGVKAWQLADSRLELSLTPEAASELGLDEDLVIHLNLSVELIDAVDAGLRRLLGSESDGTKNKRIPSRDGG